MTTRTATMTRRLGAALIAICLPLSACGNSGGTGAEVGPESPEIGIPDAEYSLEKLIEAAKQEPALTVTDATGRIVDMAEAFGQEYGLEITGTKLAVKDQQEVLLREFQAGNVQTDVYSMGDVPTAMAQLLPEGAVVSWMPPDLKDAVPQEYQSPLVVHILNPLVWAYNTEKYGDTCPVDNMWALTDAAWSGKVAIEDPLLLPELDFWFNQMETHYDSELAAAYEEYFGKPLETTENSATAAWVKALAANQPIIGKTDTETSEAVGAPGQSDPPIGHMSTGKFRENEASGFKLGLCSGMKPWIGYFSPKTALIASGTDSPNMAKLFVRWMLTQEGAQPQLDDGKLSTNSTVKPASDDPSNVVAHQDEMFQFNTATAADDFQRLPDWQDFWRLNIQ